MDNINVITIDISLAENKTELHELLKNALDLPEDYGMNFDALHDMLTGYIPATHLEIYGAYEVPDEMEDCLTVFANVLSDSAEENPGFTYEFIEEVGEE